MPNYQKVVAVHLPHRWLEAIEELVKQGMYPNRSETIRMAVRDLLKDELQAKNDEKVQNPPWLKERSTR